MNFDLKLSWKKLIYLAKMDDGNSIGINLVFFITIWLQYNDMYFEIL